MSLNRRNRPFAACLSVLFLGGISLSATSQNVDQSRDSHPHRKFDQIASASLHGSKTDVEAATDQLFQLVGVPSIATEGLAVKQRVVHAEMLHRSGKHNHIDEDHVVRTVNGIADRLHLPAFARTTQVEVRRLHVQMAGAVPRFAAVNGASVGTLIVNPQMSPLEAVALTTLMMQQKLHNPDYQLTKEEAFFAAHGRKTDVSGRTEVLSKAFRSAPIYTIADAKNNSEKALDDLGLSRLEAQQ